MCFYSLCLETDGWWKRVNESLLQWSTQSKISTNLNNGLTQHEAGILSLDTPKHFTGQKVKIISHFKSLVHYEYTEWLPWQNENVLTEISGLDIRKALCKIDPWSLSWQSIRVVQNKMIWGGFITAALQENMVDVQEHYRVKAQQHLHSSGVKVCAQVY